MISKAKEARPQEFLYRDFPGTGIARGKATGVGAEKEGGAGEVRGGESDPKRGANITDETKDGVKMSFANQMQEARIIEAKERFRAGSFVGYLDPIVPSSKGTSHLTVAPNSGSCDALAPRNEQ